MVFWCMNMGYVTGVSYVYISAMFFITGDRLCLVLFPLMYKRYWNVRTAQRLDIFPPIDVQKILECQDCSEVRHFYPSLT